MLNLTKKKWLVAILFILALITLIALVTTLDSFVFAVQSGVELNDPKTEYLSEHELQTIRIGSKDLPVQYEYSQRSSTDGEMRHEYAVLGFSDVGSHCITLNDDGQWIQLIGIEPFDTIENISSLSEQELRGTVERMMENRIDFSVYNRFELRHTHSGNDYILKWYVERDAICNISFTVWIDSDGNIDYATLTDACPESFTEPFLPDFLQEHLTRKALKDRAEKRGYEYDVAEFTIDDEVLTLSYGKRAINYSVSVTTTDGWCMVYVMTIVENAFGYTCYWG